MSSWKNSQTKSISNVNYNKVISKEIFSNIYKGPGVIDNYTNFMKANDELATCSVIRDFIKETNFTVTGNSDSYWSYKEGILTPYQGIKIGSFGYNSDSNENLEIVSKTLFYKDLDILGIINCKKNTKTPIIETNTIKSLNFENNINVENEINFKNNIIADEDVIIKKNITINNKLENNGSSFLNDANVKNITFNDGSKLNSAEYYSKYDIKKLIFDINNGKINLVSENSTFISDTLDTRYYVNNTNLIQEKDNSIINQNGDGVNEIKQTNINATNKIIQKGKNDIISTKGKLGIGIEIPECELHIVKSNEDSEIVKFSFLESSELSFTKDANENITMNVINNSKKNGKLILHDNVEGCVGICNSDPNYHLSVNGIINSSLYYTTIDSKTRFNGIEVNNNLELIQKLKIYKFEKIIEPKIKNSFSPEYWANNVKQHTKWRYEYGFLLKTLLNNSSLKDIVCNNEELLSIDYNSILNICIGAINEVNIKVKKLENDNIILKDQNKNKTILINTMENTDNLLKKNLIDLNNKYQDLNNKYQDLNNNYRYLNNQYKILNNKYEELLQKL